MKVGDVVHLNMTIESCDKTHVHCVWFAEVKPGRWTGPHRRRFRRDQVPARTTGAKRPVKKP
jgi:hypothetical protein